MRSHVAASLALLALTAAGCAAAAPHGRVAAAPPSSPVATRDTRAPVTPGGPTVKPAGPSKYCGEVSDGGGAGGIRLYADPVGRSTVPCDEAQAVMAEFLKRAPKEAAGDHGSLWVDKWECTYGSGPTGDWLSTCSKDKRQTHAEVPPARPTAHGAPSQAPSSSAPAPKKAGKPPRKSAAPAHPPSHRPAPKPVTAKPSAPAHHL